MTDHIAAMRQAREALKQIDAAMPFPVGRAAIATLDAALAKVQEPVAGWKMVPVELTQEMTEIGAGVIDDNGGNAHWSDVREAYAAMLNAAPPAPAATVQEPVAHLWQHDETGRTRVVMPDQIFTTDANWKLVGPLFLKGQQ